MFMATACEASKWYPCNKQNHREEWCLKLQVTCKFYSAMPPMPVNCKMKHGTTGLAVCLKSEGAVGALETNL